VFPWLRGGYCVFGIRGGVMRKRVNAERQAAEDWKRCSLIDLQGHRSRRLRGRRGRRLRHRYGQH
jgi:hypothetical protein